MQDSGVLSSTVLVFGQMNESPGVRARIGLTGLTMAEFFRDEQNQDVLLFVDNIYRYILAGMEVSALLGRMPSAVGYQPTLSTEMGALQERITSTKAGSITSFQAIYVPADDYTDPGIVTTFGHLDGVVSLERSLAAQGLYPAVDPLASYSRILEPGIVGEEHYNVISAFIKSMRGSDPDAAVYWLMRMLEAGEDPLFIARRLLIFASEDIGNADPAALPLANATYQAVDRLGMPEARIVLAQAATYLACAPRSNAAYVALDRAISLVKQSGSPPVPLHLRNAPTQLMSELGYGNESEWQAKLAADD